MWIRRLLTVQLGKGGVSWAISQLPKKPQTHTLPVSAVNFPLIYLCQHFNECVLGLLPVQFINLLKKLIRRGGRYTECTVFCLISKLNWLSERSIWARKQRCSNLKWSKEKQLQTVKLLQQQQTVKLTLIFNLSFDQLNSFDQWVTRERKLRVWKDVSLIPKLFNVHHFV